MTDDEKAKRIHDIVCSTDSRTELANRIVNLEEAVNRNDRGGRLTEHEKVVLTAYTGIMMAESFADFQRYADEKLGYATTTLSFADKCVWAALKKACRDDFMAVLKS